MTFLHTGLLAAGLACIAIPIAIHLLMRRRRTPVAWGAMRFILEAYRRSRRRLWMERWLLLACRCALVALVACALARPLLTGGGAGAGGDRTVYLLLDNGLTGALADASGVTALERHKAHARLLLDALGDGDRAGLVLLAGPAAGVVTPASPDLAGVRRLVDEAPQMDSATDLPGGFELCARAIGLEGARPGARVYAGVLAEFRQGSADPERPLPRLPDGVTVLVPGGVPDDAPGNISVAGLEPSRAVLVGGREGGAESARVRVTLARSGGALPSGSTEVGVIASGRSASVEARASVSWEAGQESADTWVTLPSLPSPGPDGAVLVTARTSGDALARDDVRRAPIEVRPGLRAGIIGAQRGTDEATGIDRMTPADWVRLALRPGDASVIEVVDIDAGALDGARVAALDAMFVTRPDLLEEGAWGRVRQVLERGGLVVLTPPAGLTVHAWTDRMRTALGLDWTLSREVQQRDPAQPLALAPGTGDARVTERGAPGALLAQLASEFEVLARGVTVSRVLPPDGIPPGVVLALADGTPLVWAAPLAAGGGTGAGPGGGESSARGLFVVLASAPDLEWTDLPARPLMVPLLQEVVRQGIGAARGSWALTAGARPVLPARTAELRDALGGGAAPSLGVDIDGRPIEALRAAGAWHAVDERGTPRSLVTVNPDQVAGRVMALAEGVVDRWLGAAAGTGSVARLAEPGAPGLVTGADAQRVLAAGGGGRPISTHLLIGAVVLGLVEMLLARWSSHAGGSDGVATRRVGRTAAELAA